MVCCSIVDVGGTSGAFAFAFFLARSCRALADWAMGRYITGHSGGAALYGGLTGGTVFFGLAQAIAVIWLLLAGATRSLSHQDYPTCATPRSFHTLHPVLGRLHTPVLQVQVLPYINIIRSTASILIRSSFSQFAKQDACAHAPSAATRSKVVL